MAKAKKKAAKKEGKKGHGNAPKYDWPALEVEFVQWQPGEGIRPSIEAFASEKNIPWGSIKKVSWKGKWLDKREKFWIGFHAARQERAQKEFAERAAAQDVRQFDIAQGVLELTERTVTFSRDLRDKEGNLVPSRPSNLSHLANAAEKAQKIQRLATGKAVGFEGGVAVNVNVGANGNQEKVRAQFEAARAAGQDVDDVLLNYFQFLADSYLGNGAKVAITYPVEKKKRKALQK